MVDSLRLLAGLFLSLILLSSVGAAAYAEEEISEKYRNPSAGYEITFPKGWSGVEFLGFSALAAPGGFDFFKPAPEVQIMVLHFNTTIFQDTQSLPEVNQDTNNDCKELSKRYVSINKFRVYQVLEECTTNGKYSKTQLYYFGKKDYIIGASFTGNSTGAFSKNLSTFEQSVKTLKIEKQIDIKTLFSKIVGTKTIAQKVDNKTVKIETTSALSGFKLNKAKKELSFTAEGKRDTRGLIEVSIGTVLKGPYKVTIDGKDVKAFDIIEDTTTKEILVSFAYDHKTKHSIAISGLKIS